MHKLFKTLLVLVAVGLFISMFASELNGNNSRPLVDKPVQAISNRLAQVAANTTNNVFEKMTASQDLRTKENNELMKRKQRLASLSGCSTNAKRTDCKCFDKAGSTETILDKEQCLAVVDRGLAALNDF